MEQLGNCKGQLNKERELRVKAEEELRGLRRGSSGSVGRVASPGAMMMRSALVNSPGMGGAQMTPTGTIRSGGVLASTPVTPALPEQMLKIKVKGVSGLPGRCFAGMGKKGGTVYLEFSSTGVVGTSTVDAVCTRASGKDLEGGGASFNQVLSMIISPSAVIKIQVYKGSPFSTNNEMVAYATLPAVSVGGGGSGMVELEVIEGGDKAGLEVGWVWGEGMNSPKSLASPKGFSPTKRGY
jgi:hypothetical protein